MSYTVNIFNGRTLINKCSFVDPFKASGHFNNLVPYYKRLGNGYHLDLVSGAKVLRTTR